MAEDKRIFKGIRQENFSTYSAACENNTAVGYLWFVKREDGSYGDIYFGTRHYGHFDENDAPRFTELQNLVNAISGETSANTVAISAIETVIGNWTVADKTISEVVLELSAATENFVVKEEGKGLSTNDFSNEYKEKLDTVAASAQTNVIESISFNGSAVTVENKEAKIQFVQDEYNLAKQESPESGYASTYYLTKNGVQVGEKINITKDQFLKSVELITEQEPGVTVDVPYLKFTFITVSGESITRVSVKGLVDVYTAGNGIEISGNVISVKVAEGKNYLKLNDDGELEVNSIDTDVTILQNDIQVTENVGQLVNGQTLNSGMSVYDILVKMLSKEKWATSVSIGNTFNCTVGAPTLSKSSGNEVEVGTKVSFTGTSNESYTKTQNVTAKTFTYGYKEGSAGTWTNATSYTENLINGIEMTGDTVLATVITGFSGLTGERVTATTINITDAVVVEGENKVVLNESGKTAVANTVVTPKEFYVATNLKNYKRSENDPTPWIVSISDTWNGDATKPTSNTTNASVTGKYYYYFGSLSGLGIQLSDLTVESIKSGANIQKGWITKDGTTTIVAETSSYESTGSIVIAMPIKYALDSIQDAMTGTDYKDGFENKDFDEFVIGSNNTTKYKVYLYKNQAAYLSVKNVKIKKA